MNKINILSVILLIPIIGCTKLLLFNYLPNYNSIMISIISLCAIAVALINIFNKNIIEKKVEVVVEKKVYIEKSNKTVNISEKEN